jgi:O-Antigen ligase
VNSVVEGTRVADPQRLNRHVWWAGYAVVVGGGLMVAAIARRRVTEPYLGVSLAIILLLVLGWLIRPRATLYAVLFLTAVSDQVTVSWFPFVKNPSSRESISYVADALTFSPLEIALYLGVTVSCLRRYARTHTLVPRTPLTWPIAIFTLFVFAGFARGILRGGDLRVAILEARAILFIALVFIIVVNECVEPVQHRYAVWAVLTGIVVQSLLSIEYLGRLDAATRDDLDSLNEHGSAIGQNLLIVTLLGIVLLKVKRPAVRWALVIGMVPTLYIYFVAQRRAGIAALVVAGIMLAVTLFWRRRRAFWLITPIVTVVLTGYVGAFWNSTSSAAFPAQAIKTIIAPESASAEDQSSDLYRIIEAYDLNFTIRTNPLLGLGFGQPFYRPVPLPDISFFELNAYQPHNSVLWIWIKLGFGGFVAMFYMLGKGVMLGADRVRRMDHGIDLVVTLSATLFIVMYTVYTYVDVSWDPRNTVFLGLAFGIVAPSARRDDKAGDHDQDQGEVAVIDEPARSPIPA